MARRQADPTARRAHEAARRATAAQRIGPRPTGTPCPRRRKPLFDLEPPGAFSTDWDSPVGMDTGVMARVTARFGAGSTEAATMRVLPHFRGVYGPNLPLGAIGQLELLPAGTDLLSRLSPGVDVSSDDARNSVHSLHARGMILVADDGSVWTTVPPGTPHSAPDGGWTFVERVRAPAERIAATS
ncbi:hypothetical protein GTY69_09265 [Streptomyces sp. SID8364]|nr:hypothetical protein [Streptomyces sp. SID8364]